MRMLQGAVLAAVFAVPSYARADTPPGPAAADNGTPTLSGIELPAQTPQREDAAKRDDALLIEPVRLLQAGDVDAALPLLDAAIAQFEARYGAVETRWYSARDPAESLAYLLMAAADIDKGALKARNARILPSDAWPLALYMKGYALIEKKRFAEARELLGRAVAFSPFNAAYLMELSQAQRFESDWAGMLATAQKAEEAIAFAPEKELSVLRGRVWRGQGFALTELGRLDEAEAKYRKALELDASDKLSAHEIEYIAALRKQAK